MSIELAIVVLYILVLFAISTYARKLASKGSQHYILAGRNLTTPLVAVSIAGLAIGGASTIGVSESAYKVGLSAGWYNAAWAAGAVLLGLLLAKKYRDLNFTTIPELFERYYDTKGRVICVIGQIIIQLATTSLQYVAGGAILASLLPDVFTIKAGMITSAVVFIGMTVLGGFWSGSLANILNVTLIYLGVTVGTVLIVLKQGGIAAISSNLPANGPWFEPFKGVGLMGVISWFVVMTTMAQTHQAVVQIVCAGKDSQTSRNGFLWGAVLMIPIGFLCALMGIAARAAHPDISPTMALPQIIMSLNPYIAGLVLASLWAADVSTATGLLMGSGTLFAQDIWKRFIQPDISDAAYTRLTRITVLLLGLLTLWGAMSISGVIQTLLIALSLTTAYTIVIVCTLFFPGLCRKNSAFYTTLAGIIVLILWQLVPAVRIFSHVIYLEWLVCVGTFLLVSFLDAQPIKTPATDLAR
ncbi:MAG: symporter [Peptococcaceae bacterium]|jgi:SSS family solute:Na+ symporter|nr:symporter [Peptococcaceae bacterium]